METSTWPRRTQDMGRGRRRIRPQVSTVAAVRGRRPQVASSKNPTPGYRRSSGIRHGTISTTATRSANGGAQRPPCSGCRVRVRRALNPASAFVKKFVTRSRPEAATRPIGADGPCSWLGENRRANNFPAKPYRVIGDGAMNWECTRFDRRIAVPIRQ